MFLVRTRLFLYRIGIIRSYTSKKPVLSIGNITMGGTGKTPMIDWFLTYFSRQNTRASVLTRGYGARRSRKTKVLDKQTTKNENYVDFGDEPWLLFKHHPQFKFYISPKRVQSARIAEDCSDILLLDDGMQHIRLNRTLNIVLLDCVSGVGNGQMFPLGPLREPLENLSRADIIIYSRSNLVSSINLRKKMKSFIPEKTPQFDSGYIPAELISCHKNSPQAASSIANKRCLLFSGIGNPTAFEKTIQDLGGKILDHLILSDHQKYDSSMRQKLKSFITGKDHDYVICTEKDWVKLEYYAEEYPPFWYLTMKVEMGEDFTFFMDDFMKNGC
ncbi:tetraacyldisaccharide 4'-kinase [bacterium]|nr:tetraacyldisaccharide 4'-kinase [bacterium]